jgi:nicotinate-nucleotide pyrophosphorylase (carboxylating)
MPAFVKTPAVSRQGAQRHTGPHDRCHRPRGPCCDDVAGLDLAALAFKLIDPAIVLTERRADGESVAVGDVVAVVSGPVRGILTAERVALKFLSRLSGIATATASIVASVRGHRARIVCTRKTTPGLRAIEKYAVRAGGGSNHRFDLDDAVLIKDNHIAIAGGVRSAIERARASVGHLVKIELEVDTLAQLEEALAIGVDAVLLDKYVARATARSRRNDRRPCYHRSVGPYYVTNRRCNRGDRSRSHLNWMADA